MKLAVIAGGMLLLCLLSAGVAVWNSPINDRYDHWDHINALHGMERIVGPYHVSLARKVAALNRHCNAHIDYSNVCRAGAQAFERCAAYFSKDFPRHAELMDLAQSWRSECSRYNSQSKYTDDAIDVPSCLETIAKVSRMDLAVFQMAAANSRDTIIAAYCPRHGMIQIRVGWLGRLQTKD